MRTLLSLPFFVTACGADPAPPISIAGLDPGFFECEIQPILDRECAFSGCHGDPGRGLFVYSMSKRRIEGAENIGEPLTDLELCRNFYRAAAFRTDPPETSQLVTKPATLDAVGSQFHEGNYLFGPEDLEAACFRLWLSGEAHAPLTSALPPDVCKLPWRSAGGNEYPVCAPRDLDCQTVVGANR
ncbi:MAG: hypothetical protein HYV07_30620 [Deltaproteobacteria bacterium]|nr:hypothetical protein [Deltaproteobacteria bacterium]